MPDYYAETTGMPIPSPVMTTSANMP